MATATVLPPTLNQQCRGSVPSIQSNAVKRIPIHPSSAYTDFSNAFLSANLLGSPSRKRTLTTSIIMHATLIAIPLLLSAWFTDTLDIRTYTQTLLVAPPAAAPAPTPPPNVAARQPVRQSHRLFSSQGKLFMPPAIPKQVVMLKEAPLPPDPEASGVFGGIPGGVTGGVIGGLLEAVKAPEAPPPPPPQTSAAKTRIPVPVGGNVQPPSIMYQVNPDYPTLAHQAGIQGEVIIAAVIDSQGNVVDMKVVSGPPLLYMAAMKALAKWKFQPTYLNGEPVPIKWNVSVKFRIESLHQSS
jgi:TonB family protein